MLLHWYKSFRQLKATKLPIHAFVTSERDNCNSLLYGLPNYLLKRLQHVQNAGARLVCFSPKAAHITLILTQLHWLPVQTRIEFKILLITLKALHGRAPAYIKDLIKRYQPVRELRSAHKSLLVTQGGKKGPSMMLYVQFDSFVLGSFRKGCSWRVK